MAMARLARTPPAEPRATLTTGDAESTASSLVGEEGGFFKRLY
jgi:hypothetical protein